MLEINKIRDGEKLTVCLKGRIDSVTSRQLRADVINDLEDITSLVLDCTELSYLSSAGLRFILNAQQIMEDNGGSMVMKNICRDVYDVLETCGFLNFLTLEQEP